MGEEPKKRRPYRLDEPTQSDATILMKVEDLIHIALGPADKNVVNFKMVQQVLYILARQMRLLDKKVEVRVTELTEKCEALIGQQENEGAEDGASASPSRSEPEGKKGKKEKRGKEEKDRDESAGRLDSGGKDKGLEKGKQSKGTDDLIEDERTGKEKGKGKDKSKGKDSARGEDEGKADAKGTKKGEGASGKGGEASGKGGDTSGKGTDSSGKGMDPSGKKGDATGKGGVDSEKGTGKGKEDLASGKGTDTSGKGGDKKAREAGKDAEGDKKGGKSGKDGKGGKSGTAGGNEGEAGGGSGGKDSKGQDKRGAREAAGQKSQAAGGGGGRPSGASGIRVGSVEVVSQKEFAILQSAVQALKEKTSLPPPPTLPDNKKLREDIAKGNASLTDTMQAMQLGARVQAAEKAVSTMTEMLTELAVAGALPKDIASKAALIKSNIEMIKQEMAGEAKSRPGSGKAQDLDSKSWTSAGLKDTTKSQTSQGTATVPTMSLSKASQKKVGPDQLTLDSRLGGVTHPEMDDALQALHEDLMKCLSAMTQRAQHAADVAANTIKHVSEKMDVALKLDTRISSLHSLVRDYADQLRGFNTGLSTQMAGFQEQMGQMRSELANGLKQLENVNNNAETTAVLELTERYEGLVSELDSTLHNHQDLSSYQHQLSDELKSLVECVEMMREQKADRDEVQDGLRDKADSSRLAGLVSDQQFQQAKEELEMKMQMCYDKFRKQDAAWMKVVSDYNQMAETKAELMTLISYREESQTALQALHQKVKELARLLGDPKAAMLTRQLANGANCGVCRVPALMDPVEPIQPFSLEAARPPPAENEEKLPDICVRDFLKMLRMEDSKQSVEAAPHLCLRWVGGSHTLTAAGVGRGNVTRERATQLLAYSHPVKRYTGFGTDGKMYNMEEGMVPCVECNLLAPAKGDEETKPDAARPPRGGGDYVPQEKEIRKFEPDDEVSPSGEAGGADAGDVESMTAPTAQARESIMERASIIFVEEMSRHETEVGSSIKGIVRSQHSERRLSKSDQVMFAADDAQIIW